jgi:hypothetical protein
LTISYTHTEEHPTPDEHHLSDRIWLVREAAVLSLECFQFDGDVSFRVLESVQEV